MQVLLFYHYSGATEVCAYPSDTDPHRWTVPGEHGPRGPTAQEPVERASALHPEAVTDLVRKTVESTAWVTVSGTGRVIPR